MKKHGKHKKHHPPKKHHRHKPDLLLVMLRTEAIVSSVHFSYYNGRIAQFLASVKEGHMANKQLTADAKKGFVLTLAESLASTGEVFPLSAGPFQVAVTDPSSTITVVPGSDDQKTPTIFRPNGSLATGTVTVDVTDTSNGLKGSVSFDVIAPITPPPPPPAPDTLTVDVTPEL